VRIARCSNSVAPILVYHPRVPFLLIFRKNDMIAMDLAPGLSYYPILLAHSGKTMTKRTQTERRGFAKMCWDTFCSGMNVKLYLLGLGCVDGKGRGCRVAKVLLIL